MHIGYYRLAVVGSTPEPEPAEPARIGMQATMQRTNHDCLVSDGRTGTRGLGSRKPMRPEYLFYMRSLQGKRGVEVIMLERGRHAVDLIGGDGKTRGFLTPCGYGFSNLPGNVARL